MITASHNPWQDNGVKFFAPGGLKLPDNVERAIEALLDPELPTPPAWCRPIGVARDYARHSCRSVRSLDGLRVVLDCANGAMRRRAGGVPRAGRRRGRHPRHADRRNINDHCGATHCSRSLRRWSPRARDGPAFDGDGDRVIAIDDLGTAVDGDRLIALAALQLREEGRLHADTVVVTVMSNLGFHKAMAAAGIHVATTAVGDRYVLEALDAGLSVVASRAATSSTATWPPPATACWPGCVWRSSCTTAARWPSSAGDVMTSYPQVLVNVRVRRRHPQAADEMAAEIAAAEASLDGDGRILVRASGTEPLIRVMVEAATQTLRAQFADDLAAEVLARWVSRLRVRRTGRRSGTAGDVRSICRQGADLEVVAPRRVLRCDIERRGQRRNRIGSSSRASPAVL